MSIGFIQLIVEEGDFKTIIKDLEQTKEDLKKEDTNLEQTRSKMEQTKENLKNEDDALKIVISGKRYLKPIVGDIKNLSIKTDSKDIISSIGIIVTIATVALFPLIQIPILDYEVKELTYYNDTDKI